MRVERLSVVVPSFNCARYLPAALDSIRRQAGADVEIIVVDDGSTDETAGVVRAFGGSVRYVAQERGGAAAATNRGVREASGNLLGFLDADDVWATDKTARQLQCLHEHPSIDMVFGHALEFFSEELSDRERLEMVRRPGPLPAFAAGTMIIRREVHARVAELGTVWRVGSFIDWYTKAVDLGLKSEMLSDVVLHRRLHRDNTGRRERDSRVDYVRIVKNSLDRRRAAASQES